jgi:hypothetical protein
MKNLDNPMIDETLNAQWETGSLGNSLVHAKRAPAEVEAQVEAAAGMKLVTIRLPVPMIDALKAIAQHHGIGYQPMVRDLLGRFASSEIQNILQEMQKRAADSAAENTAPVNNVMQRERKVA